MKIPYKACTGWDAIAEATGYSVGTLRVYASTGVLDAIGIVPEIVGRQVRMTAAQIKKLAERRESNAA